MNGPQRLWRAMETVPGLQLVREDWNRLLGTSWGPATRLIRTTGGLATGYPCMSDPECGCVHGIVDHGDGDFVSVCRCRPRECDPRSLVRDDVVVREVDLRQLAEDLARALGSDPSVVEVDTAPMTWLVGILSPTAGYRFPIYLTVQTEPDEFQQVVDALVARAAGAFLLVAPTRAPFSASCDETLRRVKACFLALSEEFDLDASGAVAPRRLIDEILGPFLADVMPAAKPGNAMAFFPTPPDATWAAVQIKFKDGHTVSVRVGSAQGVFNYTQMGMASARNGNPTKQWTLLQDFAERHGALDWSSPRAHRNNQKRKETLAENLRAFFRIDGDPFEVTERAGRAGKGWRTRFSLEPQP